VPSEQEEKENKLLQKEMRREEAGRLSRFSLEIGINLTLKLNEIRLPSSLFSKINPPTPLCIYTPPQSFSPSHTHTHT